ncbi:MAG: aminotransferase class V-fold PLP-dependent enzyme, partial [Acidimicrobiales bacterium]
MTGDVVEWARALDEADPFSGKWECFKRSPGEIYLDGNSLGPLQVGLTSALASRLEYEWGTDKIRSWSEEVWIDLPHRVGRKIAPLIGAGINDVVVSDSTSVNLFKVLHQALALHPDRDVLIVDGTNFPSDRYVAAAVGESMRVDVVPASGLVEAVERAGDRLACVVAAQVDYRTGARISIDSVTEAAHRAGGVVVWDLSHSAGVIALRIEEWDVDFAVGCTYKFLNGGPGSPAFVYVAPRYQSRVLSPIPGWWGDRDRFAMRDTYEPAPRLGRQLVGTPYVVSLTALDLALDIWEYVDMRLVESKAATLTATFMEAFISYGGEGLAEICTPSDPSLRGGQISLVH